MTSRTIRILVIDDDQGDFEMARSMIGAIEQVEIAYDVDWVSSFQEAVAAFDQDLYDVYFVDYFLEDQDGLTLVREARERGVKKPVIMLTGRGSHAVDVEAMQAGASDYLVKGKIDPDAFERTIRYAEERIRAQEALRQSEERHRGMFDHLPIGLFRCSPDGDFVDANPALVRILGRPDLDTLRSDYAANFYVAPADRTRFVELLKKYGVARGFESRLERPDGTAVWVRNTARAHRLPDGGIEYLEGTVEDVTDLHLAQRLRGNADRFDTLYRHSRMAIILLDRDGLVIDGNPAFDRCFGYQEGEVRGRPFSDLVDPADRAQVLEDLRALHEGLAEAGTGERRLLGADGTHLWARILGSLVRDAEGQPDHVMLLLEDVAEA